MSHKKAANSKTKKIRNFGSNKDICGNTTFVTLVLPHGIVISNLPSEVCFAIYFHHDRTALVCQNDAYIVLYSSTCQKNVGHTCILQVKFKTFSSESFKRKRVEIIVKEKHQIVQLIIKSRSKGVHLILFTSIQW